ncbi:MAG: secretin N-terminal domain-containing protein [Planctomycetota bacterium]|nr:secretin N-terminal domain-containing protein [Planctomycetota bacterium]
MAIITRAIKVIDVPLARDNTLQATIGRMQIYHLSTMNPEPLVKTLKAIGNLDLDTKLEVDTAKKAIIAYATLADHVTIRALIEKLDGSGREFHVIRLRRLEADYVAGTIKHMIFGGEEEPKKNERSRYYGFFGRSSSRSDKTEKADRFQVDADVESNRLLLWANNIELEEVNNFLLKLGEIPPEGGSAGTIRVLDAYDEDEAAALIEKIRRVWSGKNKLQIDTQPGKAEDPKQKQPQEKKPEPKKPESKKPESKKPESKKPESKKTSGKSVRQASRPKFLLAQLRQESPAAKPQADAAAAIKITRDAHGRMVIASEDTAALDLMEQLIADLSPPPKDYQIFRLKHAWAYDVVFILESFFKEEAEEKENAWDPFWGYRPSQKTKTRARLSKRRPLRFILDSESNSILVQGAGAEQLKQIQELVDLYDKIEPPDSQNVRQTEVFTIRYSKANVIAEAIKEVYRDLLSSSDKAFSGDKKEQKRESRYTYIYGSSGSDDEVTKAPKFKGLLSIGVDDVSNTLIVSAPTYLFAKVSEMIQTLDRAAWPVANVRVVRVGESVNRKHLEQLLMAVTDGTYQQPQPLQKKTSPPEQTTKKNP